MNKPVNYSGTDPDQARFQAQADGWIRDIVRSKAQGTSTLTAADRLDLQEIVVAWDNAFDALDREGLLSLVAEDVRYTCEAFGVAAKNRAEMGDWFDSFTRTFHGKRHVLTNFVAVGQGDAARMVSYLTVFERVSGTDVVATSVYNDAFRREGGRWVLSDRQQVLDPGMGETGYGKALFKTYQEFAGAA